MSDSKRPDAARDPEDLDEGEYVDAERDQDDATTPQRDIEEAGGYTDVDRGDRV